MTIEDVMYEVYRSTEELWEFRSNQGQSYWLNREKNLTNEMYPYLYEVKDRIRQVKENILKASE
jgi:hypothetical protein